MRNPNKIAAAALSLPWHVAAVGQQEKRETPARKSGEEMTKSAIVAEGRGPELAPDASNARRTGPEESSRARKLTEAMPVNSRRSCR